MSSLSHFLPLLEKNSTNYYHCYIEDVHSHKSCVGRRGRMWEGGDVEGGGGWRKIFQVKVTRVSYVSHTMAGVYTSHTMAC